MMTASGQITGPEKRKNTAAALLISNDVHYLSALSWGRENFIMSPHMAMTITESPGQVT
jgi:hypothetical protein